jgi:gamma-glutamylcyclotransferase (GGCT)/AIG2-like uncharacterized protein YtfP
MEIDKMISDLNKKDSLIHTGSTTLEKASLSQSEKHFIQTYKPERTLIVYGSLAPGESNHAEVKDIKGTWQRGIIKGKLEKEGWAAGMGYYGFRHTLVEEQEIIKAYVLFSDELVSHWQRLDEFEGNEYKRVLAKIELENGEVAVGFIYAINEDSPII